MRSLILLLLSLLATSTFAQTPAAPTVTSVTQSANKLFAVVSWTSSDSCPLFCFYTVYRDGDIAIDSRADMGEGSFTMAIYFGEGATDLTYGTHSFYVVKQSLVFDMSTMTTTWSFSPSSNVVTATFVPPPPPVLPPGDVVGDPQFMGLKGQLYQVHGAPNEVFSIISDNDLQYNSKFVYLDQGECPTSDGKPVDTACFTHPGTYLGDLGLETAAGDRVFIRAGGAAFGFAKTELNGQKLEIGEIVPLAPNGFVVRNSSHVLTIQAGNFRLEFTNSDSFVNQVVEMLDTSRTTSHGLLGQSWSTKVHNAKATIPWIEGTVWDYAVEDHKVFSDKFTFNKFERREGKKLAKYTSKMQSTLQQLTQQTKDRLIKRKN